MKLDALTLTQELITRPSVTPDDGQNLQFIAKLLSDMGFEIEWLNHEGVYNLWATIGKTGPLFCFAGHTDVVPTGDLKNWHFDPFSPTLQDGLLYGRGAADMKSGLAAMLVAANTFLNERSTPFNGRLAFLLTSDEEGAGLHGTQHVMRCLAEKREQIQWCVVGEPSSQNTLGDTLRIGRRGSLTGYLTILGKQGHIAYPHLARNPIHLASPFIQDLIQTVWDTGYEHFPPSSLQIANIQAGTGASNVIPGTLSMDFNFRYNPQQSKEKLTYHVISLLQHHNLEYTLTWTHSAVPFLTDENSALIQASIQVIDSLLGIQPVLSTGGGTSDARFIAPTGAEVVEIGVCNKSIHQSNEHVLVEDILRLQKIYHALLQKMLG